MHTENMDLPPNSLLEESPIQGIPTALAAECGLKTEAFGL